MAFFISPSYSGKYGALAGLGLTLAFMAQSVDDRDNNSNRYQHPNAQKHARDPYADYIGLFITITGYLTAIYSVLAYRRIRLLAKKYLIESAGV